MTLSPDDWSAIRLTLELASIVTVFGGSLPWLEAILNMLPLQQFQLGWIIPALAGLLIGGLDSAAHSSFKR